MLQGLLEFKSLVTPFNTTERVERDRQVIQEQAKRHTLAGFSPSSDVISFYFKPLSPFKQCSTFLQNY